MTAPPNLPAALLRHAASHREEPWLFRAEGWDWRWHSWGEIAREVLARAETLSAYAAGSRHVFPYTARPEAIVLDLAIQAAGLVSVPTSGPPPEPSPLAPLPPPPLPPHRERGKEQEKSRASFLISAPSLPVRGEGRGRERGGWGSEGSPGEGGGEGAGEEGRGGEGVGGAVVLRDNEPVELSAADLVAMAEQIQKRLHTAGEREIVVLSGSIGIPEERAMLSWATLAGAAVVLEPNPALRAATAAWVRPTAFHGTPAELTALRRWVEKEKKGWLRRRPRLPFRRLRTVLVMGPEALPEEDEAFWTARGVRVAWI